MPRGNYNIQRVCEECGKIFTPPTLTSKYCCSACSKRAYKKRQIAKEKEAIRQALARRIPSTKGYLTVKEAVEKPRDFDPFGQTGFAHLWLQYD